MITREKIAVYEKFDGDIDGRARCGTKMDHELITDDEWFLISNLVQRLKVVENGLASSEFAEETHKILKTAVAADAGWVLIDLAKKVQS